MNNNENSKPLDPPRGWGAPAKSESDELVTHQLAISRVPPSATVALYQGKVINVQQLKGWRLMGLEHAQEQDQSVVLPSGQTAVKPTLVLYWTRDQPRTESFQET